MTHLIRARSIRSQEAISSTMLLAQARVKSITLKAVETAPHSRLGRFSLFSFFFYPHLLTLEMGYSDSSPKGSRGGHLRKRSSVSNSPFVSQHLIYDDKTGDISLPSSPPLHSWKEKSYYDEKRHHNPPPYSASKGSPLPKRWLSLIALAGATLLFITIFSVLAPARYDFIPAILISQFSELSFSITTVPRQPYYRVFRLKPLALVNHILPLALLSPTRPTPTEIDGFHSTLRANHLLS